VSKATARRATLQTGAAALAVSEAQEERLKRDVSQASAGGDEQVMSGDGALMHFSLADAYIDVEFEETIGDTNR
jgi:hypothetical protein